MSPRAKYNNRSDSQAGHELFPSIVRVMSEQTPHCWCACVRGWHTHSYLRVSQHILERTSPPTDCKLNHVNLGKENPIKEVKLTLSVSDERLHF